jgi:adenine-specific DNA-methyltransferase
MEIQILKPRQALNKAFLKVKPNRAEIECFKANLTQLLDRINDTESEEFHKNLVSDFLKDTYYKKNHFINTKGRNDLVIHNGDKATSTVGVVIEAKKPANKAEMLTKDRLNVKAFQELVLYYLRERITHKNIEIKHLIATNINEWFFFDATLFDRLFAQNKTFVKHFEDFEGGRLADTKTDFFYKQIAEPFIADIKNEIEFTYFDIRDYEKPLRNDDKNDDNKLIALFKLLSPEHLLKLPFANDSNSLDKRFYGELLHLIGLTETKDGGKKIIERNKEGQRNTGSFIENAIIQLNSLDKISRLENPNQFGSNAQERLFNVALELSITWVNRILFLKLLEGQLLSYHKGDKSYEFLNSGRIQNYDDLNSLFFQVLARKHDERDEDIKDAFAKVPYLNSSLFEPTDIEHTTLFISNLRDDKSIPIYSQSVLKDDKGKRLTGELSTIEYLLRFLSAYDFASEGSEEIQEDNKTLINASVLGLIFEKINGYKDGSFFTPGFITMYMCRETIRKAVIQKFDHDFQDLKINRIEDIYELIPSKISRKEANAKINSLKICDPAVGSGHFLVSALNEIIAIKNDLKILDDKTGKSLNRYEIEVVNDELIVTDEDGELFEYNPTNKESQRIQETLFHEKQAIIENCLFGVDINPNSVKICRLRLWIELLKNAYYKNATELETLPNIDINIKCGNSLISRYPLDASLKTALRKSKWSIESYRAAIATYRSTNDKTVKREMEKLILQIKQDFTYEIRNNDPAKTRLDKLANELYNRFTGNFLFEPEVPYGKTEKELKKKREAEQKKLETEIKNITHKIEEIKSNKIYENAFEWRFEFPEVLDDNGDFVGFDVVIGNPPYLTGSAFREFQSFFNATYTTAEYQLDLYAFFIELSNGILKSNGIISLITPNSWLKNLRMSRTRKFVLDNFDINVLNPNIAKAFEEASVDTLIFIAIKTKNNNNILEIFDFNSSKSPFTKNSIQQNRFLDNDNLVFDVEVDESVLPILKKIRNNSDNLETKFEITRGVNPYDKYRGQTEEVISTRAYHSSTKKDDTFVPELKGKHVSTFQYKWDSKHFISYGNWLAAPRDPKFFKGSRLVFREIIAQRFVCAVIEEGFIIDRSLYIALPKDEEVDVYSILGVLCSKLLVWLFKFEKNEFDELFPKIRLEEFKKLPIPKSNDIKAIGRLTKEITKLKQQGKDTSIEESQIDQLVYQLYDLTAEEIDIIENGVK